MDLNNVQWRKSSHSGGTGGECVELAALPGSVGVRDSKNPHAGHLTLSPDTFRALLGELKR